VSVQADAFRVGITQLDNSFHRSFNAVQHVTMRGPGVEMNIRLHDQVSLTDKSGELGPRGVARGLVAVKVLGVLFIEIDQHGQLLPLLVVVRDGQRALEPDAGFVFVLEQDAAPPAVFRLPGIGIRNALRARPCPSP